jgi:hydrogenase maturation factor
VVGKLKNEILVGIPLVVWQGEEIFLQEMLKRVEQGFVKKLRKGDYVSLHLGIAREKISAEMAKNLMKITQEALEFFEKRGLN